MAAKITTASAAVPGTERLFTLLNEPRAAEAGEPLLMRIRRESPVRPSRGGLLYWHTCQLLTPLLTRRSAATPLACGATASTGDTVSGRLHRGWPEPRGNGTTRRVVKVITRRTARIHH